MPILVDEVNDIVKKRRRKRDLDAVESSADETASFTAGTKKFRIRVFNIRDEAERLEYEKVVNELLVMAEQQKAFNIQIRDYSDHRGNIIKAVEWVEIITEKEEEDG